MGHPAALARTARLQAAPAPATGTGTGYRVYGVVPAGAPLAAGPVELVRHRQLAALVAAAVAGGARRAMLAHVRLLDTIAATTPVLPVRFGTLLPAPEAVQRELLEPHHDAILTALRALAGRAQFTVRARYLPDVIVREVLDSEPAVAQLHQRLGPGGGQPPPGRYHPGRVRLGELVARAVQARRAADARTLADSLRPAAADVTVQVSRTATGDRIADAMFLVDLARRDEFEQLVEQLAGRWRARARLRLIGPMAAYHFAGQLAQLPAGGG